MERPRGSAGDLQGGSIEYIPVRVCPLASFDTDTGMSAGERLATNGLDSGGGGGGGGENGELLSLKDHAEYNDEGDKPPHSPSKRKTSCSIRGENCCEKFLRCLSYVPCGSLIAWIILLLGLGALAGSLILGTRKARHMLEEDRLLWFMEFSVTGVVVSMFVIGTSFLVAGHLSTDPTSRRIFNSSSKNRCARGFNVFLLVFIYILCLLWILLSTLLATPIVLLVMMYLVTGQFENEASDCLELQNYGFSEKNLCSADLDRFKDEAKDVLICYGVSLLSSLLVVVSLVHFLICISANITHLRDNRFATLNAYETEDLRNSKGSILDTNM